MLVTNSSVHFWYVIPAAFLSGNPEKELGSVFKDLDSCQRHAGMTKSVKLYIGTTLTYATKYYFTQTLYNMEDTMPTAKDIMTKNVYTVTSEMTIERLARILINHKISGVPVLDDNGKLIGIVTEDDLISQKKRLPYSDNNKPL